MILSDDERGVRAFLAESVFHRIAFPYGNATRRPAELIHVAETAVEKANDALGHIVRTQKPGAP